MGILSGRTPLSRTPCLPHSLGLCTCRPCYPEFYPLDIFMAHPSHPSAFAQSHLLKRPLVDILVENATLTPPQEFSVPLAPCSRCCRCPIHIPGALQVEGIKCANARGLEDCGLKDSGVAGVSGARNLETCMKWLKR